MGPQHLVVVDLGFGDAGKGTVVDAAVRRRGAHTVVRFNGGAQAGHTVCTADGRTHIFSQFGAGSFVPGVRTLLGPDFLLHPLGLLAEVEHLARVGVGDALARLTVHRDAVLISPFHQAANRLREAARGAARHGSCGLGIGEAVSGCALDGLFARDLSDPHALLAGLRRQQERLCDELLPFASGLPDEAGWLTDPGAPAAVVEAWRAAQLHLVDEAGFGDMVADGPVVWEGAQGALLDQTWGFHPHTTWSDCTAAGALRWCDEALVLGVLRAYSTRHGAGPFPAHDPDFDAALSEPHNGDAGWQGAFRRGPLDEVLLRYALAISPVDALAITHVDRALPHHKHIVAYDVGGEHITQLDPGDAVNLDHREALGRQVAAAQALLAPVDRRPAALAERLGRPLALTSAGPTAADKRWA